MMSCFFEVFINDIICNIKFIFPKHINNFNCIFNIDIFIFKNKNIILYVSLIF